MKRGDLVRFIGDETSLWRRHAGIVTGETGMVLSLETREFVDESGGVHYHDSVEVLWANGQVRTVGQARTVSRSLLEVVQQAEAIDEAG